MNNCAAFFFLLISLRYFFLSFFKLHLFAGLFIFVGWEDLPWCNVGVRGQRTISRSWFSSSTVWVLKFHIRSSDLEVTSLEQAPMSSTLPVFEKRTHYLLLLNDLPNHKLFLIYFVIVISMDIKVDHIFIIVNSYTNALACTHDSVQ